MNRVIHVVEQTENAAIPGYSHVSVSPDGRFRSTLQYPGTKREERGGMTARQKRKFIKAKNLSERERESRHAVYVGPEAALQGRGALVRYADGKLLAQFDLKGHPRVPDGLQDPRCFGWHEFQPSDFASSDFADSKRYRKD